MYLERKRERGALERERERERDCKLKERRECITIYVKTKKTKKKKKEKLTKKRYVASFFTPVCITLLLAVGCLEVIRLNGDEN